MSTEAWIVLCLSSVVLYGGLAWCLVLTKTRGKNKKFAELDGPDKAE